MIAAPLKLWPGRWVKFADAQNFFPEAFHAKDGRVVGIYCQGNYDSNVPYIAVVDEEGFNLVMNISGAPEEAKVAVNQPFLAGVVDRRDIPPNRIKHLPPEWQPRQ